MCGAYTSTLSRPWNRKSAFLEETDQQSIQNGWKHDEEQPSNGAIRRLLSEKAGKTLSSSLNSNRKVIERVVATDWEKLNIKVSLKPAASDLIVMKQFLDVTHPFESAFQVLQYRESPAIAHVVPSVYGILFALKGIKIGISSDSPVYPFVAALEDEVSKRLRQLDQDNLYTAATTLHPMYKLSWVGQAEDPASMRENVKKTYLSRTYRFCRERFRRRTQKSP